MELDQQVVLYVKEIESKPLLTKDQELELAKTIQSRLAFHAKIKDEEDRKAEEQKDSVLGQALETLTVHNLKLSIKEAFTFSKNTGVNVQELIGAGNLGLMKAAYLYNPVEFNTRFATYATYWIRQAMFEVVHGNGIISVPIHILNGKFRHNKLIEQGVTNSKTLMRELEVNKDGLKRIRDSNVSILSLDQEINTHSDSQGDSGISTLGDLLPDEKAADPSKEASDKDKYNYLYEAMEELDDMSKDIISAQILQDDKIQLRELGKKYGVTGERIRQIRVMALNKLRKKIERRTKVGMRHR